MTRLNETAILYPYQLRVRRMLVIDALSKPLLTPEEIRAIEELGLKFGPEPKENLDEVFFVKSVVRREPDAAESSTEAMMRTKIRLVFFTRQMVVGLKRYGKDIIEDIRQEIENIEEGWRNSFSMQYGRTLEEERESDARE